jgi:hypothetical protein
MGVRKVLGLTVPPTLLARRRGDRIATILVAMHMSLIDTWRPIARQPVKTAA